MYLWVLRCWDPHPAKAIFSSGVINLFSQVSEPQIFRFSGRRVWRFFVPGTPGTVRRQIFFPCRWEDEGKGVEEKPPKTEMPWMMRCLILRSVFWFLIFIAQLKDPQRILYICSRRWRKETSSKMFLMMSSLLHIVYDVSWCVSIFYSSFHDFESCLIHLFFHSSRPPMFDHVCPSQPWSITKAIRNRQNRSYESSLANKPPNWRPSWSVPSMWSWRC